MEGLPVVDITARECGEQWRLEAGSSVLGLLGGDD